MPKRIKVTTVEGGFEKEIEIEVPDEVGQWPKPADRRLIGKSHPRLDGEEKVTGKAKYTYDINLPNMLYARVLRSPYAHARVVSIDTTKAEKLSGVHAVIAYQGKEVRFVGDAVAVVAAETEEIAEDALRLIDVEYEELGFAVKIEDARKDGAPSVRGGGQPNVVEGGAQVVGNPDEAFAQADVIVEQTYVVPTEVHACLEPHGAVVRWDGDDRLTIWCSTQSVQAVRDGMAGVTGLPAANIRSICEHMGAGFGSKFGPGPQGETAAQLARRAGRPVKLMNTRKDEFISEGNRPEHVMEIKAGATKAGKLIAFQATIWNAGGIGGGHGVPLPYIYSGGQPGVGNVPNRSIQNNTVFLNTASHCAMRAPGHPEACFAMEGIMDELAEKIGMDPVEFRKLNLPNDERGDIWRSYLDIGAEAIGWKNRPKTGSQKGIKRRGMGCGICTWGGGPGSPRGPITVKIYSDGIVEVNSGVQDIGTGTRTVMGIIAAEELGIPLDLVKVRIGDSQYGEQVGSGGSVTTAHVAAPTKNAAMEAKFRLFGVVAPALNAKIDELDAKDGKIFVKEDPKRSMTWKQACAKLGMNTITAVGTWTPGLDAGGVHGAQFAEVEVDTETGEVKVTKMVAVQDCGMIVNKLCAESQTYSGMIHGIAYGLMAQRIMDSPTGAWCNADFENYKIPTSLDMPTEKFDVLMQDRPQVGVIGLGEPPTIPGAAAIANAVANALGVRIRTLPITPDKVLNALKNAKEA